MAEDIELKSLTKSDFTDSVGVVVGTRPSIVMFSPIIRELSRRDLNFFVIHTGQHYSYNMDGQFFDDLGLHEPDYRFNSVSGLTHHGEQTAEMLERCEEVLLEARPQFVLVGGDANFNLAGALAARKLHMTVGHVEAGERSGDWRMPEEHNRVMIDHISDYLFTTNETGKANLIADNVAGEVVVTGNPIVDAVQENVEIANERSDALEQFGVEAGEYALVTMHREENVDSETNLSDALSGIARLTERYDKEFLFLAHPRTQDRLDQFGLDRAVADIEGLHLRDAVGYLDFLRLLSNSWLCLTDSGGVQQESCILSIPCVTLRDSTEWTEALQIGATTLVGTSPDRIVAGVEEMASSTREWENPFGDAGSAERIVDIVETRVGL